MRRHRILLLDIDRFGQTGGLPAAHRAYRINADAIVEAMAALFL